MNESMEISRPGWLKKVSKMVGMYSSDLALYSRLTTHGGLTFGVAYDAGGRDFPTWILKNVPVRVIKSWALDVRLGIQVLKLLDESSLTRLLKGMKYGGDLELLYTFAKIGSADRNPNEVPKEFLITFGLEAIQALLPKLPKKESSEVEIDIDIEESLSDEDLLGPDVLNAINFC
jgi:hypothetical protein